MLSMLKMSKIDQIHLRAVMPMYVEDVEDCICSLYATLHAELLILLLMSKVSKM